MMETRVFMVLQATSQPCRCHCPCGHNQWSTVGGQIQAFGCQSGKPMSSRMAACINPRQQTVTMCHTVNPAVITVGTVASCMWPISLQITAGVTLVQASVGPFAPNCRQPRCSNIVMPSQDALQDSQGPPLISEMSSKHPASW